jgi:hypothetical protein
MQTLFVQVVVQVCLKYIQMEIAMPLVSGNFAAKNERHGSLLFTGRLPWRSFF